MKQAFLYVFIILLLAACNSEPKKAIQKSNKAKNDSIQIIKKPYKNSTKTEYEIPVFRGTQMKHGIQKRYYLHGSLYSAIPYDHGQKHGTAYTYYQAGEGVKPKVWKEQPYVNNMLHGICKRYHQDGTLQAEYEYNEGLPAIGLKEYSQSGKPLKQPTLIVTKSRVSDGFYITARLSNKSENVDYLMGELKEGKYIPKGLKPLQVKKGLGEVVVRKTTGRVTITAVHTTRYRNKSLITKTINL